MKPSGGRLKTIHTIKAFIALDLSNPGQLFARIPL